MSTIQVRPTARTADVEDARRTVLHRSSLLSEDGTAAPFDRVARLARRLLGVDTALVSLIDRHDQVFKGHDGLRPDLAARGRSALSHSYCKFAVATGDRLVVPDARDTALLSESPAIGDHDAVAYVGIPLEVSDGAVLGTLCVFDSSPRSWTAQEVATLEELADVVVTEIEFRLRQQDIEEVAALVSRLEEPVAKLGDVVRTTAHLAEQPNLDPRLPRLADVARSRMSTVEAVTQDVVVAARPSGTASGPEVVDVAEVLRRAQELVLSAARADDLQVQLPAGPVEVMFPAGPTSRALHLLVTTALNHLRPGHRATVQLHVEDDNARVRVTAPGTAVPAGELLRIAGHFHDHDGSELAANVRARAEGTRVHNKVITAVSDRDGTTFDVCLPQASTG